MTFSYDPRYNIAYIRFAEKRSDVEAIQVSDDLVVDISPDGTVYGIELLNANAQLKGDNGDNSLFINEVTGERVELPLAV